MKQTISMTLALCLTLALTACGGGTASTPEPAPQPTAQETAPAAASEPAPQSVTLNEVSTTAAEPQVENNAEAEQPAGAERKALVVYFSRTGENYTVGTISTGNTAIVGDWIAKSVGADVFEIVPETPYPDSYDECLEVATQEQRSNARPAYVGEVEGWEEYDTVFFGYPIWWGDMPMIAYTFLENHDFTGKTVIPFNTHEGSGQSGTQRTIESLCSGATVIDGLAVRGNTAQNDRAAMEQAVSEWLSGMDFF